jgi:osmotically-inducible protein OsmY
MLPSMAHRSATGPELSARITERLEAVPGGTKRGIFVVATDDGRVRLEGSVHTFADHLNALAAARSTPGVSVVEDRLQILL